MTSTNTATTDYAIAQAALAATKGGKVALVMRPGDRWIAPNGDECVVVQSWTPGTDEDVANSLKWFKEPIEAGHNEQIMVSIRKKCRSAVRIHIKKLAGWLPVPNIRTAN